MELTTEQKLLLMESIDARVWRINHNGNDRAGKRPKLNAMWAELRASLPEGTEVPMRYT